MYTLQNHELEFTLDSRGRLIHFRNKVSGRDYAGGYGLWRIIYQDGPSLEEELLADEDGITFSADDSIPGKLLLDYHWKQGFRVRIEAVLKEEKETNGEGNGEGNGTTLQFTADLENASCDLVLREFQFPMLKNLSLAEKNRLIWSSAGGEAHENFSSFLELGRTKYMAQDNLALQLGLLYPGCSAAMNFYLLDEYKCGLYVGSHDSSFQQTYHLFRKRGEEMDAGLVKYPFLKPDSRCRISGYVLALYNGTWHRGADIYRDWLKSWYVRPEIPQSVRELRGWQRIILRHQYGRILYRYDQLPELLEAGLGAGIDTLFLFGWHSAGHDSMYPEYVCDETQGGFEALKAQISEFRRRGGKLILYFNGQLIDMATEFYHNIGHRISLKRMNGQEHQEVYPFGGNGTALRLFGNKNFTVACPACREWHEVLKKLADLAIALEADGVFFDQLGYAPSVPCSDPTHGHEVPFTGMIRAKRDMLRELRDYVKSRRPEMSFGIEIISDVTAQYADYVHGLVGPSKPFMPDVARYVIPGLVTTDREIRDDTDIRRRVNLAVLNGLRSDVEIYRCRASIDAAPNYKAYLAEINRLRSKYTSLILNGEFRDTLGAESSSSSSSSSSEILHRVFETENRIGVVLTPEDASLSSEAAETTLRVPGAKRLLSHDGTGEYEVSPGKEDGTLQIRMKKESLLILEFEK